MRAPLQGHLFAVLLETGQYQAIRHGAHQRIEEVDHLVTIPLQLLDHFLAREQGLMLVLKLLDVRNLRLDLLDFSVEEGVAILLARYLAIEVGPDQTG